ncbi:MULTISPECIES: TDT family transporter [unclassified Microbacterium]|uniref:SLAC1 family transporter n=1 Tax=unclassified Microbacterium TaxID=2609290 RepID=UPI000B26E206|nr:MULTISPECIES: TDT family transporter [unclassified Microbacterium]
MSASASPALSRAGTTRAEPDAPWLPLNLFAIPLGLAGLGGAWSAASTQLGASPIPAEVSFAIATLIWAGFTVVYLTGGLRRIASFTADLRHPLTGPFTAYIPVVAILLIAHYAPYLGDAAVWLILAATTVLAVIAAQLVAHWLTASIERDALHPGYFLPVVAGSFIASIGFTSVAQHEAAIAAIGIGVFFWLVIGTIVMARLVTGAPLPPASRPALAILVTPPGTASVAWFAATGGSVDVIQEILGGIVLFMFLVQLALLPGYLRAPFTMQYWVFTFPAAVLANDGIRWAFALQFPGWQTAGWIVLGVFTTVILAIIAASIWKFTPRPC